MKTTTTNQLPTAIELEEAVVGACLLEKDGFIRITETLKAHHFSSAPHKAMFEAVIELFNKSQPVDLLTVADQMNKSGTLEGIGGPFALIECTNKVASTAHIEAHAKIIVQQWMRRELIKLGSEMQSSAFDATKDEIETINATEMQIDSIKGTMLNSSSQSNTEILHETFAAMDRAAQGYKGVDLFGVHQVDELINGLEEDLLVVAGRPGMGKSSLVNAAIKHCVVTNTPALFWSMEMTNRNTMLRLLSACTGIEYQRLRTRSISTSEDALVMQWADKISNAPIVLEQRAGVNILDIKARAISMKRKQGLKAVFIDRLELLNDLPSVGKDNKSSRVGQNTKTMRQMAQNLQIPIICLCQLSRAVEGRANKIPTLADLRESGDIEQDATKVAFLYRPEYYGIESDDDGNDMKGKALLVLAKNTNGATGAALCNFNAQSMVFETASFNNSPF